MNVVDLRPDLRMVLDSGPGQAYLLRRGPEAVLVDTGIAGQGGAIAQALRGWDLDRGSLTHVVLTHWHPDHAGSAAELASWPNVQIWAHRSDAPIIRGDTGGSFPALTCAEEGLYAQIAGAIPDAAPSRVDRELDDNEVLDAIGACVLSTPGHTDGSIALHFPNAGILFTGDIATAQQGQSCSGRSTMTGRKPASRSGASLTSTLIRSASATASRCVARTPPSCAPQPPPARSPIHLADATGSVVASDVRFARSLHAVLSEDVTLTEQARHHGRQEAGFAASR
jgi:glyoxylase-like metal-dependent hydrolase (beta-lactamase superfamily II)